MEDITLWELQRRQSIWMLANFPGNTSVDQLLGVVEEVGELSHAHLKAKQGIRGTPEEHHAAKVDAIGDILVFLAGYCTLEDIDFQGAVQATWETVEKRNWKKDPLKGQA